MMLKRTFALIVLLWTIALPAYAESFITTGALKASYEELTLPGNERMGMVELGMTHDFTDNISLGFGSWMAVKGERGGFITLGLDGVFHYPITEEIDLDTGLYIGAGGGRGGYTLSGGGLMLRTHAGLRYNMGSKGWLESGVSSVDFPNGGTIHSTQPFFSYTLPFTSSIENGWSKRDIALGNNQYSNISPKVHSLALVTRHLNVASTTKTDTGGDQGDITLLGIEWRTYLGDHWYVKLETEGAAGGASVGYMQILAGSGYRIALTDRLFSHTDLSIGAGGGGGIDSGGGLLLDGSAGMQYSLTRHFFADLSTAHLKAAGGTFQASTLAVKLGYQTGSNSSDPARYMPACMQIRVVNQTYQQASDLWRTHHAGQSVDNLGLQMDYFINPDWYITGQGLAAYKGDAGAFMTGLVGTGVRKNLNESFYLNAETLAGAGGGGGLAMGSGLVWQGNAGVGYEINPSLSALATVGRMEAVNGAYKANVIGLSLAWQFNVKVRDVID